MALGPNFLDKQFQQDAADCEKFIDNCLATKTGFSNSSGYRAVTTPIPSRLTDDIFIILQAKYIKAGWQTVTWESDQREDSWLSFTAPDKK